MLLAILALALAVSALATRLPLQSIQITDSKEFHSLRRSIGADLALTGIPATAYTVIASFGTPAQNFSLVVDTGSSNLAVAASSTAGATPYYVSTASSSFINVGSAVAVQYAVGAWTGTRITDMVQLASSGLPRLSVDFAAITSSSSFFNAQSSYKFQGILGLAYIALARPSGSPITPLLDSLVANGANNSFGLQLCDARTTAQGAVVSAGGFLQVGAGPSDLADISSGAFVYAPLVQQSYYTVSVTDVAFNGQSLGLGCSLYNSPRAIVDSGTTNLVLPQAAYDAVVAGFSTRVSFQSASDKALFFSGTQCFTFPRALTLSLPAITITLAAADGVFDLKIPPWTYLRILAANTSQSTDCRVFGVQAGCGSVLGISVLSSYTALFDRANSRVGFAPSTCSNSSGFASATAVVFRSGAVPVCSADASICASSTSSSQVTLIVGLTLGGVAIVAVTALLLYQYYFKPRKDRKVAVVAGLV